MTRTKLAAAVIATTALALAGLAPSALARSVYATSYEADSVSVLDSVSGQVSAPAIPLPEGGPFTIAISADGKTAYAVNFDSKKVAAIDTATNKVVGPEMPVGTSSYGIAITPDGTRAYVTSEGDDNVAVLDLQARQPIVTPIDVGESPNGIGITPDGKLAYVANGDSESVSIIDLATNQVTGMPIPVGKDPYAIAIAPDGKTVFVGSVKGGISVIDTATNQVVGPTIPVSGSVEVAISPDGKRLYATDFENGGGKISIVDTATRQILTTIEGLGIPEYMALSPDGQRLFFNDYDKEVVGTIDLSTNLIVGTPVSIGDSPGQMAVVPDQSPTASFAPPTARVRPGVPVTLSGAASSDPDGTVATYSWNFGDGAVAAGPASTTTHAYAGPGTYSTALTVTDNEGCSVPFVFTGQTAYCHGSPGAAQTQTVKVAYPGVKVKCPKSAKPGGCKFKLKAVLKTGKGKKQKLKAQSAVAKVKVKVGKSAVVSLKPKQKYAAKLAGATKTLVQRVVTIAGHSTTKVGQLKIVQ
jgi:YVTN family beta-propeller protein